jgi:DNA-binding transcriptional ArsR family regulator
MSTRRDVQALIPRALFRALGDPTRIAILDRLARGGQPQSVGEVAESISADLSIVSRNLRQLREVGLLRCERDGKRVLCRLDTTEVVAQLRALADALEQCCPPEEKSP